MSGVLSLQEALKAKKLGKELEPPRQGQLPHTKRYLILTYVVEFDRVHYPLPLAMEDTPTIASQARHIRRLKRELTSARAGQSTAHSGATAGPAGLGAGSTPAGHGTGAGQTVAELQAQLQDARAAVSAGEEALEKLRTASRAEVKRLRAEVTTLTAALEAATTRHGALSAEAKQVAGTMAREAEAVMQLRDTNEQLRAKVQELTRQLALAQGGGSGRAGVGASSGTAGRQQGPRTPSGTPTSRGRPTARTPGSTGSRGSSVGSAGSSRGPSLARRPPGGLAVSVSAGSSSSAHTAGAAGGAKRSTTPTARTPNGRQAGPVPPPPAKSRTPTSAQGRARDAPASARAAYGTPYTLPAHGSRSNSRGSTPGSTPGRSSVPGTGAANYLAGGPGRGGAAVASPSSSGSRQGQGQGQGAGVSPATARIYSNPQGSRARASASPAGSRGHASAPGSARAGSASAGGGSGSLSVGPGTGTRAVLARTYLGGVEPILAGIDAQIAGKGLNKMHSASPGRLGGKSSPGPPKRVPVTSAYAPAGAGRGLAITGAGANSRAAAPQTQRPTLAEPAAPPVPSPSSATTNRYDASGEIVDIDARLAQLQEFLRAAKTGQPLPELPVTRS